MTAEIISWSNSTKVWDRTGIELAKKTGEQMHLYNGPQQYISNNVVYLIIKG